MISLWSWSFRLGRHAFTVKHSRGKALHHGFFIMSAVAGVVWVGLVQDAVLRNEWWIPLISTAVSCYGIMGVM